MNRFIKFLKRTLLIFVLLLLGFSTLAQAIDYPEPTIYKYVNDYAGVLSRDDLTSMVSIGKELEDKTGAQAVVVIFKSLKGVPIDTYGNNLFRTWGIGEKSKDNGLLLLVSIDDKAWRIEVGRGLEGALPDALTNRIMINLAKPYFAKGQYSKGLLDSYSVFCDYIANEYDVTLDKSQHISTPITDSGKQGKNQSSRGAKIPFIVIAVLLFMDLIFNRGRVFSTILQLLFITGFHRGGGRGGGNSGGGFGGFGGGNSNGGGSSGNW